MAKRKRSPMPEDIDFDAWEEEVARKQRQLDYDKDFLAVCEWLICAESAECTLLEQMERCLEPKDMDMIKSLFDLLALAGYCIKTPEDYYKADADEFVESTYYEDDLPEPVAKAIIRLAYAVMTAKLDMGNSSPWGY